MKNQIQKKLQRTKMKSQILTTLPQDQTKERRLQRTKMKNQILKILHHQQKREEGINVLYNNVSLLVKGKVFTNFLSILLEGKLG